MAPARTLHQDPLGKGGTGSANPEQERSVTRTHDFGTLLSENDQVLSKTFRIPNPNPSADYVAHPVNPKPCCLDMELASARVAPGGDIVATLSLRAGRSTGSLGWFGLVLPEDESQPRYRLMGTATIIPRTELRPARLSSFDVLAGSHVERELEIQVAGTTGDAWALPDVSTSSGLLEVALKPAGEAVPIADSRFVRRTIPVTLRIHADSEAGIRHGNVSFDWPKTGWKRILPVAWEVKSPVLTTPKALIYRKGDGPSKTIRLVGIGDHPLSIEEAQAPAGYEAEVSVSRTGSSDGACEVRIRRLPGKPKATRIAAMPRVRIITDAGAVTVPILVADGR